MREKLQRSFQDVTITAAYALAYLAAWFHSADQFFLPAGLRIAALLFAPYRRWPAIFVGDAVALCLLRVPIAEHVNGSAYWPYISALLTCPVISIGTIFVRLLQPNFSGYERVFSLILPAIAVWGAASNMGVNFLLGIPSQADLFRYSLGQYLAILALVPPALLIIELWACAKIEKNTINRQFGLHVALAILALAALFAFASKPQGLVKLTILGCMLIPAICLTFAHGWRGAVIGVASANCAIGFSMSDAGLGNSDSLILVAQEALAVIGTMLLVIGSTVTKEREKSARLDCAEKRGLHLDMLMEKEFRNRAASIARAQKEIDKAYRDAIFRLKSAGKFDLAMQLTCQSFQNTQMLFDQANAIYPVMIEREGIFEFLRSSSFAKMVGDAKIRLSLSGDISLHTLESQLATYRCILHALDLMSADFYSIKVRAWSPNKNRGLWIRIDSNQKVPENTKINSIQLEAKVRTHGGAFRMRPHGVTFFILSKDYFLAEIGTTIQDVRLLPRNNLMMKSSEL